VLVSIIFHVFVGLYTLHNISLLYPALKFIVWLSNAYSAINAREHVFSTFVAKFLSSCALERWLAGCRLAGWLAADWLAGKKQLFNLFFVLTLVGFF